MTEKTDRQAILTALLERHGKTYSEDLGLTLSDNKPAALFQWLCASLLMSARISTDLAMSAARALNEAGWTTAGNLAESSWEERVKVLNRAGYARFDEKTAGMLGELSALMLDKYQGDLRRLRADAAREPAAERRLLKEIKGMGDVGVDIFFREAQLAWPELYPFADKKALKAAKALGLASNAEDLAELVEEGGLARLAAALVRMDLAKDTEAVKQAAEGDGAR